MCVSRVEQAMLDAIHTHLGDREEPLSKLNNIFHLLHRLDALLHDLCVLRA